jgi:hypothetical protein
MTKSLPPHQLKTCRSKSQFPEKLTAPLFVETKWCSTIPDSNGRRPELARWQ